MRLLVRAVVPILVLVAMASPAWAQSDACTAELSQAEAAYYAAEFDRAVQLLRACLDEAAPSDAARVEVYRLLAFAHLGQGERSDARLAVESLLDVRPSFRSNPSTDRPDFVALVEDVRASRDAVAQTPSDDDGRRWWRWVAGTAGVAALGTAAAVLLGGGGDGEGDGNGGGGPPSTLPGPPLPN